MLKEYLSKRNLYRWLTCNRCWGRRIWIIFRSLSRNLSRIVLSWASGTFNWIKLSNRLKDIPRSKTTKFSIWNHDVINRLFRIISDLSYVHQYLKKWQSKVFTPQTLWTHCKSISRVSPRKWFRYKLQESLFLLSCLTYCHHFLI